MAHSGFEGKGTQIPHLDRIRRKMTDPRKGQKKDAEETFTLDLGIVAK